MKYYLLKIISIIIISLVIIISGCKKKNLPPHTPYTPSGTTVGRTNTSYAFASLAIDPDGDSITMRFDWGNGDTSAWVSDLLDIWFASEQTVTLAHSWAYPDTYYIRVQAKDKKEATSEWSLPHSIILLSNKSPIATIPSGPSDGRPSTEYEFSSSGIDSEKDSVAIRFDWGDGDTSNWSTWEASGNPVSMVHFWSGIDTFYIRAQAKDKRDSFSLWSDAHPIAIVPDTVKLYPNQVVATIRVDSAPQGIATLPNGDFIYVTNCASDIVSVIRHSDFKVVQTIYVEGCPIRLAVLPDGYYIYVACAHGGVSVIRTSDNTVVDTIRVGNLPYEIISLPNGDYVYVTNSDDNNVSVIRTLDNTVVGRVHVGRAPQGITALPNGNYVYVANLNSDDVSVIRTSDNRVVTTIPVGFGPHHITSLPSGDFVYVSNRYSRNVSVIRTSDNTVVSTIPIPCDTLDGIEALPNGHYVFVVGETADCIYVIRVLDNMLIDKITVGHYPEEIVALPNNRFLYVTNLVSNDVTVIDP